MTRTITIIPLLADDFDMVASGLNLNLKVSRVNRKVDGLEMVVLTNRHRRQRRAVVSITDAPPHHAILRLGKIL